MKKILFFASALTGLFFAASCQRDNLEPVATANTVTITVEAPGAINTKAIADGTNVNEVHYAVYKTNSGEDYAIDNSGNIDGPLAQGVVSMTNKVASIDFDLLQDQDYTVIFWAQVAGAGHYTLGDLRTITIEDDVVNGNDETRAAFFARYDFSTYEHQDHKVTLRRPFAQLNLLTTPESLTPVQEGQTTGYTIDVKQSEVKVMGLGKSFNTLNGIAPKADEEIVFEMAATPEEPVANGGLGQETLVVNGKPYHYVSMNYFFVPEEEKLVDIEYTVVTDKGNIAHEILAVPTKENYRTNVIGNLLTRETTFEIFVDADFDGSIIGHSIWDGETVTEPVLAENTYLISSADELAWLAAAVNGTLPATRSAAPQTFEGCKFVLTADIDLNNEHWTPIGYWETFNGTFDGQGHTIFNLKHHGTAEDCYVGLFGYTKNATIKNLTINNVDLKLVANDSWAGGHMGALVGNLEGASVIENITVTGNVKIDGDLTKKGAGRIGGVVGGNETSVALKKVVVNANEGSFVKGNNSVGGIAGQLQGVISFENCSSNVDVTAQQFYAGGIIGLAPAKTSFANCSTSGNISVLAGRAGNANDLYRVGAIAGGWGDNTTYPLVLENCSYTGKLAGKSADGTVATSFDCAGFVGRGYVTEVGAKVVVNGAEYEYQGNGTYSLGGKWLVTTAAGFQAALDNGSDVVFMNDIEGDVTATQAADVKLTVDGDGHEFAGVITVDGKSATYTTAGLTVKNVNFVAESISADACVRLGDGTNATRYTCNVALENCIFDVPGAVGVKSYTGGDKNLSIKGCTATDKAHSLVQAKGVDGVLIENCTVNSKNGMNFNNSDNVTVNECTTDVKGYAVRFGESSGGSGAAETYAINNSTLKSACNDGDAVIILRGTADNSTLTITNTTLEGTKKIANSAAGSKVLIDDVAAVATADALVAALKEKMDVIFLNDITVAATKGGYNKAGILQNNAQTIDGDGYTLTVTGAGATWDCAIYTNGGTIKNLTVAGAMRGIFTAGQSSDLHIDNVVFKNVIYTFNSDGKMPANPFGVYVSNSVVNGWTSHSNMHTEVVYTNCSFGEGSGYKYCRPYGTTSFVNCTFCAGYTLDKSQTTDITFTDCIWE